MKRIRLINIQVPEETLEEIKLSEGYKGLSEKEQGEYLATIRENSVFKYKEALLSVMRTPLDKNSGLSIEELERSLTIITAIKAIQEGEILELDDSEMDYLLLKLNAVRINGFDERWVTLRRTVKNSTKDVID
jgi:hypothetical protein